MATNTSKINPKILTQKDIQEEESLATKMIDDENDTQNDEINIKSESWFKTKLKWRNVIVISFFHLYFVYLCFTIKFSESLKTGAWFFFLAQFAGVGVTAGAHRLWTHRAYKAKWPIRFLLVILYSSAGMYNLHTFVRDHRVHHKYTDTDADPYGSHRGFFFSHVGWLMMKRHPEMIRKSRQIDMSDILADPIAMFSIKYHDILTFIFTFLFPVIVPVYGWNETWYKSLAIALIHYILTLNFAWTVNSIAHIWGSKPYDGHITSTENLWVSILSGGEGWHNYHHVFPWDYKAAELRYFNSATIFIDFCAKFGWAYDLKQPSEELVKITAMKNGSHSLWNAIPPPDSKII